MYTHFTGSRLHRVLVLIDPERPVVMQLYSERHTGVLSWPPSMLLPPAETNETYFKLEGWASPPWLPMAVPDWPQLGVQLTSAWKAESWGDGQFVCKRGKSLGTQPTKCPPEAVSPRSLPLPRKQQELGCSVLLIVSGASTGCLGNQSSGWWGDEQTVVPGSQLGTTSYVVLRACLHLWQNPITIHIHLTALKNSMWSFSSLSSGPLVGRDRSRESEHFHKSQCKWILLHINSLWNSLHRELNQLYMSQMCLLLLEPYIIILYIT